jgi:hypothetical protein
VHRGVRLAQCSPTGSHCEGGVFCMQHDRCLHTPSSMLFLRCAYIHVYYEHTLSVLRPAAPTFADSTSCEGGLRPSPSAGPSR